MQHFVKKQTEKLNLKSVGSVTVKQLASPVAIFFNLFLLINKETKVCLSKVNNNRNTGMLPSVNGIKIDCKAQTRKIIFETQI